MFYFVAHKFIKTVFDNVYINQMIEHQQNTISMDIMEQKLKAATLNKPLKQTELKNQLRIFFDYVNDCDFNFLADLYLKNDEYNLEESLKIFYSLINQFKKVYQNQAPLGSFLFQSFVVVRQNKVIIKNLGNQINQKLGSFSEILGAHFQAKLKSIKQYGIINQKQQSPVQFYKYYHWVQCEVTTTDEQQLSPASFFKQVRQFQFGKALSILTQKHQNQSEFEEAFVFLPVLQNLQRIQTEIRKNPVLVQCFEARASKKIIQPKDMNSDMFNEFVNCLDFCSEYSKSIKNELNNPYFQASAMVLGWQENDQWIREICFMEKMSVADRFMFGKKFLKSLQFQKFKDQLKDLVERSSKLDDILLFGKQKISENILQNYLNNTGDLQKVAITSQYLKLTTSTREPKGSIYDKFIKSYQAVLQIHPNTKLKSDFKRKASQLEHEKRNKNQTKVFSFDCTNCKQSQVISNLVDKIKIDARQPKLKAHSLYSKDIREQLMNCIACFEVLPKCCVCLYPITVFNSYAEYFLRKRKIEDQKDNGYINKGQLLNNAVVWCQKCLHGGHYNHIKEWQKHYQKTCPVVECECKCVF